MKNNEIVSPAAIPYGRQDISEADIQAVVEVLRSDFLTQGPMVTRFEKAVADYCGVSHAVAVNSATSALHIACLALGLGHGDWLWTSPITFVASANCGLYCGASVDFVDIDPKTYNLCPLKLERKLRRAEEQGRLPKVVVPVHFAGQSCDMQAIHHLSEKYRFKIIEDASHAIGGKYKGAPIGNCRYSDIVVFSFHPVKIITTGEGGMAVTNDEETAQKMALLRSHGITRDHQKMTKIPEGPWYYQQIALGFNYRMTDIQSALGLSQINRIDEVVKRRAKLAENYNLLLSDLPLTVPWQNPYCISAWHLYVVRLDLKRITSTHIQIFNYLRDNFINVNLHYIPLHTQPWFSDMGFKIGMYPESEKYYKEAITLPLFPGLNTGILAKIVEIIKKAIHK